MTLAKPDTAFYDDVVTRFSAGTLSLIEHIIVACQSEISDLVARRIAVQDTVEAAHLSKVTPAALSPLFMGHVLTGLPEKKCRHGVKSIYIKRDKGLTPKTLQKILGCDLGDVKWKTLFPGISVYDIIGDHRYMGGDRLYLLKTKGGMLMPTHSHIGEEWTLLLTGSYSANGAKFQRGDLHIEDETGTHAPHIEKGPDCICLVMTQGPLVMQGFLPKLAQKFMGI